MLTPGEVDDFFAVVRSLVDQGKSIIFITHKLREVLAVADRITVLRGGRVAGTADPTTATQQSLANLMVGRDVVFQVEKGAAAPGEPCCASTTSGSRTIEASRPSTASRSRCAAGEIFGVAGVEGNGQRELVEAIAGMRRKIGGRVEILGHDATQLSPRQITELGIAHIPEDRASTASSGRTHRRQPRAQPLLPGAVLAARHPRHARRSTRRPRRLVAQFDVRTPGIDVAANTLSGGNQQKVIVARELTGHVEVLFVAQPTRGLDVGSIEFIHSRSSDCATGVPPCCSCRPSSTRSSRSRTGSACSTAAAWSARSTPQTRPVRDSAT